MNDLQIRHNLICMPIDDRSFDQNNLFKALQSTDIYRDLNFSTLSYGYEFVVAYQWLRFKLNAESADLVDLCKECERYADFTIIKILRSRFDQDFQCTDTKYPYVVGGNVFAPVSFKNSKQLNKALLKAFVLLRFKTFSRVPQQLRSYVGIPRYKNTDIKLNIPELLQLCCNWSKLGTPNRIIAPVNVASTSLFPDADIKRTTVKTDFLKLLISAINFPIPSISTLLDTLGFTYVRNNPFLEADTLADIPQCILGCHDDYTYTETPYGTIAEPSRAFVIYYSAQSDKTPFHRCFTGEPQNILKFIYEGNLADFAREVRDPYSMFDLLDLQQYEVNYRYERY